MVRAESRGLMGLLGDLHKGSQTGRPWRWVLDAVSILLALGALSGLVLWMSLPRRRVAGIVALLAGIGAAVGMSEDRSPEDHALESDRRQRLEYAIQELPPDQRAAVELRLAGLTGVECARALGKSPDATRMLQHRAFGTLRMALADLSPGGRT